MIVIPPQSPNESRPDPIAEALGPLYEQFTRVQNLAEFHAALRKRDSLYELQHQEMGRNPQDYENLHPKDFFNQFHRRADEDDKTVVSEAPYRIRQQLGDALLPERDTALTRAKEIYKRLFIDYQLAELERDWQYYLGKMADATTLADRERYLTAITSRLKFSGDVGLLHKEDADRAIANIRGDADLLSFTRDLEVDPLKARELLAGGSYPNIRPENRAKLQLADGKIGPTDSVSNKNPSKTSNSYEAVKAFEIAAQSGSQTSQSQNTQPPKTPLLPASTQPQPVRAYHVEPRRGDRVVFIEYDKGPAEIRWGGSRTWRNHNPGNLAKGDLSDFEDAIGADDEFAIFPDHETGLNAMYGLVNELRDAGKTVDGAIEVWAPPTANNTAKYKADVHSWTGLNGNEKLIDLTDKQIDSFVNAIRRKEGWRPGHVTYDE